ncbi:endonuclease/exonuclease/phosphatase family protein [Pontiella agarivorans]|uniref:Endonuclease/exonuclease/phosphatase family protein n=1 Tax=Pontiella agarivorans TaxID=3038953 RepID=A0ABU5MW75_9BACT|nr:endonuclease/exonuclease/phosphatase family protein [Pontiella agarivorans]MDZ8118463.1 endonuclease/exonuclease/phosphatase family protein [Pontiella agarivorans]
MIRYVGCILSVMLFFVCCNAEGIPPQKQSVLHIMSYNIKHGEGMDGEIDLKRIAEVISRTNPEIVALQEVDKNCKRSGGVDQARKLGELLGMEFRFGKFMNYQGGEYGMAILSRIPIGETVTHPLPGGTEPRCALEVRIRPEGYADPVSFVCIHNDWKNETNRVKQVKALVSSLATNDNPIILAGDFNGERTDASMIFLEHAQWTILDKNGEKTWPSDRPEVEIDFFAVRGFSETPVEHGVVHEAIASDHRPIFAVISPRNKGSR